MYMQCVQVCRCAGVQVCRCAGVTVSTRIICAMYRGPEHAGHQQTKSLIVTL